MKTKISLMLLAMGLASASAYAGTIETVPMPVSNDINVTAPDQSGMWSFGATALLMQPIGGTFDYADGLSSTTTTGDTVGSIDENTVDQNYNWWFGADITYAFPGNGRDVMLAYEGMHSSNTNSTDSADPRTFGGIVTGESFAGSLASPFDYSANTTGSYNANGGTFTEASGKVETNYDAGDLLFGQKLDVGSRIRLHPFAGVRYAYINQKDTGDYAGTFTTITDGVHRTFDVTENAQLNSTFNGIGPRFGSDAQVSLGQGFSVRGRLGVSALIGSRKADNAFIDSYYTTVSTPGIPAGTLVSTDAQSADTDSQTRVVPEIDGRLGLAYTYDFDNSMALGIEAGWQAENYFNSTIDVNGNSADFALQGPYARLQFDVA